MNDELIAAFDGLFEALLERSDAEEAIGLFTDGDVMFWDPEGPSRHSAAARWQSCSGRSPRSGMCSRSTGTSARQTYAATRRG